MSGVVLVDLEVVVYSVQCTESGQAQQEDLNSSFESKGISELPIFTALASEQEVSGVEYIIGSFFFVGSLAEHCRYC